MRHRRQEPTLGVVGRVGRIACVTQFLFKALSFGVIDERHHRPDHLVVGLDRVTPPLHFQRRTVGSNEHFVAIGRVIAAADRRQDSRIRRVVSLARTIDRLNQWMHRPANEILDRIEPQQTGGRRIAKRTDALGIQTKDALGGRIQ